jgi:type II secretory pathway pseudopilin PulG
VPTKFLILSNDRIKSGAKWPMRFPRTKGIKMRKPEEGWSLIEIMIAVVCIGILAALAITAINKARTNAQTRTVVNDIRVFSSAFQQYAAETGDWPDDAVPTVRPPGMEGHLRVSVWGRETAIGGNYEWDLDVGGIKASIAVTGPVAPARHLEIIDEIVDDGNLATGNCFYDGDKLIFVLER